MSPPLFISRGSIIRDAIHYSPHSINEDSHEELNRILCFKNRHKQEIRNSLFKNQKSIKNTKITLIRFNEFIANYSEEFKDFTQIATIPLIFENETKFYELLLKITDIDINNELRYEYILNDVTLVRIVETHKKEIKYKSLFLAKTAHELKNPILTITSLCQTLSTVVNINASYQSSDEDSEEEIKINSNLKRKDTLNNKKNTIQDTISFITATGNYLMSLIYDLNYFTKLENNLTHECGNTNENLLNEEFELIPSLEFCLTIFRLRQKNDENKKNMNILSDYDKQRLPEKIITSQMKLKQVLINLLSNAYKFTVRGSIKLSVKVIEKKSSLYLRFEIADTGVGIPENRQLNLGKPFSLIDSNQDLNSNGSGLGLYIVNDLLSKINSSLKFTSVENKGSKFSFDLEISNKSFLEQSCKTLFHKPLWTESLKNIYNYKDFPDVREDHDDTSKKCNLYYNFR